MTKPLALIILDGWGIAPAGPGNAVTQANCPNFNTLWNSYPHTKLSASGEAVGLPHGEKGNSETGHLNLGAGKIVYQDLPRINMSIADGTFAKNPAFLEAALHCRQHQSNFHIMGLISQGGVHSRMDHLFALMKVAKEQGLPQIYLHLFTDGRDSPPTSAMTYVNQIQDKIRENGVGKICTLIGRYYAMDRDNRWERTEVAYRALTENFGEIVTDPGAAIQNAYNKGETDEFLKPLIIKDTPRISHKDAVIFFNFRIDRPRELTKAFVITDFNKIEGQKVAFDPYTEKYFKKTIVDQVISQTFPRRIKLENLYFVTMTEYERDLPVKIAFPPTTVKLPLGRILSERGLKQFRIAETEKERFVTFYFNGQREEAFPEEQRLIIPSAKVSTYDLKPEMSAPEITTAVLNSITTNPSDFYLINFANPDMVGHTGVLKAGVKACEVVDECMGKIASILKNIGGGAVITADHGNIEEMINLQTGEVDTEHSSNSVPLILVGQQFLGGTRTLQAGILADVAPTILKIFDLPKPEEMSGRSLI